MRNPFTVLTATHPTSPTVPHWQPAVIEALGPRVEAEATDAPRRYREALGRLAQRPEAALAVSIRLPFCAAHCLCCDRPIEAAQPPAVIDAYVDDLCDEIDAVADCAGGRRDVLQLQLGGGSATELDESQLARLVSALQRRWHLPRDADVAAECDPRRAGEAQLELLRGLGFRRVTFGVLDLDDAVQQAIGRRHSDALVDDVCGMARRSGIELVNLDLMVGLPRQTHHGWVRMLERVITMAPDRVTLAHYRHRPWLAPVQQLIDVDDLPDAVTEAALSQTAASMLRAAGYRWIGAEEFVLEDDELSVALDAGRLRRNLVGYTGAAVDAVIGLGVGAVSDLDDDLYWNEPAVEGWRDALRHGELPVAWTRPVTERERRRRRAVEHLLCALELKAQHAHGGLEAAYEQLARQESNGFVRALEDRIVVTDKGRGVLHRLCAEFGAALSTAPRPA